MLLKAHRQDCCAEDVKCAQVFANTRKKNINLCAVFLTRQNLHLAEDGHFRRDGCSSWRAESSKSLRPPVLLMSHCIFLGTVQTDTWLLAELAVAMHSGTSNASYLVHAQQGVQQCSVNSSLGSIVFSPSAARLVVRVALLRSILNRSVNIFTQPLLKGSVVRGCPEQLLWAECD